jgi:uncharacterized protein YecE (DUF72 family)
MTVTRASLTRASVGASGWSYPSWKPGFYPAGTPQRDFLRHYAARFDTVELNSTAYGLPSEDRFRGWAAQVPDGFRFAVKLPAGRLGWLATFEERVRLLGDRLGPVRVVVQSARDEGMLALLLGSLDPALELAFDFRHPSWDGVDVPVRVGDLASPAPFRYLRFRDPPYDDAQLQEIADRIRAQEVPVYAYFRHEEQPTAPRYAERLLSLLG